MVHDGPKEEKIRIELEREQRLVENKKLPISSYNYAALNDRLKKSGIKASTITIIKCAVQQGCYLPKKKKKDRHDQEEITCHREMDLDHFPG